MIRTRSTIPIFREVGGIEAPSDVKRWMCCTLPSAEIDAQHTLNTGRCQLEDEMPNFPRTFFVCLLSTRGSSNFDEWSSSELVSKLVIKPGSGLVTASRFSGTDSRILLVDVQLLLYR
jgi:hypothetical protein